MAQQQAMSSLPPSNIGVQIPMSTKDLRGADDLSDETPVLNNENMGAEDRREEKEKEKEKEKSRARRKKAEREKRKEVIIERSTNKRDDSDESEDDLYREVVDRRGKDGRSVGYEVDRRGGGTFTMRHGRAAGAAAEDARGRAAWVPPGGTKIKPGERGASPAKEGGGGTYDSEVAPFLDGAGGRGGGERRGSAYTESVASSSVKSSSGKSGRARKKC
jgi:hypothetical protein